MGFGAWLVVAVLSGSADGSGPGGSTPVLVELFTSEGCSSCPAADALLQRLDRSPVVVVSEHVDYWDSPAWRDRYSSTVFTNRQNAYADRFGLASLYTPQMVVDGAAQFLGSDERAATAAIDAAQRSTKLSVQVSALSVGDDDTIRAHLEVAGLPPSPKPREANVYAIVALDPLESAVRGGENEGRRLAHVAVARSLKRVGRVRTEKRLVTDLVLPVEPGADPARLRLIAFVQESGPGHVLGAALVRVSP